MSGLGGTDWQGVSPCQGWRPLDILGHVGQATRFGTLLLQGAQPEWSPVEPPGAAVEGRPGPWWRGLAAPARSAVAGADVAQVVDSPRGKRTIGDGLSFPAVDLFVHGWDVAKSAGRDLVLPAEAVEFARSVLEPSPPSRSAVPGSSPRRDPHRPVSRTPAPSSPGPDGTQTGSPPPEWPGSVSQRPQGTGREESHPGLLAT
ncbi:MAG: hypothetical protein JWL68_3969 [Actinomycetia bacterium]|nr:hypothetical protein [Actinomycetes bacterium]